MTLFARREAKTRIRQRDWFKLAGEKIRREQVGTVPTFLSVRANKFAKWKIGFRKASKVSLVNRMIQSIPDFMICFITNGERKKCVRLV